MTENIVLAITDESLERMLETRFKAGGYNVAIANDLKELYALAADLGYNDYLMDPNFPVSGGSDITPVREVKRIISARQDAQDVRLLAISGRGDIVSTCAKEGISAKLKPIRLAELSEFFRR